MQIISLRPVHTTLKKPNHMEPRTSPLKAEPRKRSHLSLLKIFMKIFPFLDSAGLNFIVILILAGVIIIPALKKLLILGQICIFSAQIGNDLQCIPVHPSLLWLVAVCLRLGFNELNIWTGCYINFVIVFLLLFRVPFTCLLNQTSIRMY